MRAPPPEIEAYLAACPPAHRAALARLREQILAAAPRSTTEVISYKMPAFVHEGRALVWMGAFRHHCSIFPGSIRFAPDEPLPAALVKKIVERRLAENAALAAKRASSKKAKKPAAKKRAKKAPSKKGAKQPGHPR